MSTSATPATIHPDDRAEGRRPGSRLGRLLAAGLALRVLTFLVLAPANNDDHMGVIRWMLEHRAIPVSNVLQQSYHPPLYYMLALPFAHLELAHGIPKATQFLSLLLSLLNLVLIARLLRDTTLIASDRARRHALALAAFLPQFVVFGLFVSNDSLAFVVGTLLCASASSYVHSPDRRALLELSLLLGIGLLTKGTFLGFVPALVALVAWVELGAERNVRRASANVAVLLLVSLLVGGYKFAQNERALHRVLVHNLDVFTREELAPMHGITGPVSFVRFDLATMVADPLDIRRIPQDIPTLLYATTWYPYLRESNLIRTRVGAGRVVLSLLALAGLVPTLLGIVGSWSAAARWWRERAALGEVTLARMMLLATVIGSLIVVVAAGVKYDVFTCFAGRLLFPAAFAMLVLVANGYDAWLARFPRAQRWLDGAMMLFVAASVLYFAIEVPVAAARNSLA